jgi:RNA polymerase sigma-70 factor (ECF subfamily)
MAAESGGFTPQGKWFSTTQWSVVVRAGSDRPEQKAALSTLCQVYWRPVYSYVRGRGHDAEAARDLTQGFFAALLEDHGLAAANRERGRFRNFLLASVKNFLGHERERDQAQKRGGGQAPIRLDADPDSSFMRIPEPATHETPETIFERGWATALLDQAMADLQKDVERSSSFERFEKLKPFLVSDADPPYADLARDLKMTEPAVRVALHRMRQRFGTALRERVAQTLEDPDRVEEELRYLIGLMAG